MGIFGAMMTAVSGLRAQSYSLENISGNIANSQTTGFKRVDTAFVDMIPDAPAGRELAGSVTALGRMTTSVQGDLQATGVPTHMALSGDGFFVVRERTGTANNMPVFGGGQLYTRRGDFALDKDGFLRNGAGFFLSGTALDPVTGEVKGATNEVLRISTEPLPARRTGEITYRANLPSAPATATAVAGGSELMAAPPASMPVGYEPRVTTATTPPPGVRADDTARFMSESVAGGALTVYDDVGAPISLQMRWAKVGDSPATWNLFYLENSAATGADIAWRNIGSPVTFDATGRMTSATRMTIPSVTVDGTTVGAVDLNYGPGGLTQYAAASGLVQASAVQQNGYASGSLTGLSVTADGRIQGSYSNGMMLTIGTVAVAQFNAPDALKRSDGGVYEQTLESGVPIFAMTGAAIVGGNVEGSNTDIADEFSKMIVTQQAYSANTRVVSTAQQMLSDVLNMVR
ncbi:MAG TPA: flagellar hook-basal body complex protein [Beijerinckiaceae bacterium]|nr:flagellar hook-basal body complex protein [Beijerinckiaceae bacterium]